MDWSQALFSGIAAGANGVANQYAQDQDEQRWLEREKQLQSMRSDEDQRKARYMLALEPPKVQTINTTNDKGEQVTRQQQWVPPSEDDIKAGRPGTFSTVGETPNINFERLSETQKNNEERNRIAAERNAAQADANAAKIEIARARLEATQAKGDGKGKDFTFADYNSASPEQRALYDRYRRGEDDPNDRRDREARVATRQELTANPDASPVEKANTLYQNQVLMGADPFKSVKSGASSNAPPAPMGQFAPKPAQSAPTKQVQRTGTKNGRKVIQYSDGSVVYADTGQPVQ